MFRLIGFLVTLAVAVGGFLAIDYNLSRRMEAANRDELTFATYLGGLSGRLAALAGSSGSSRGLPTRLEAMLPRAPEGWTVRPTEPEDIAAFLPGRGAKVPDAAIDLVGAVGSDGGGDKSVALTYERGDRKVVFQAVRHSDAIFTRDADIEQRFQLQTVAPRFSGTPFMTVRGLDVTEDLLPEGMPARYFLADVGGQIQLRVLAPKRMRDKDLLPFFQTLHVAAMNAGVVDRQPGLGEVPVMVLASTLGQAARADYEADLARRKARRIAAHDEARWLAEARLAERTPAANTGGGLFDSLFGQRAAEEPAAEPAAGQIDCGKDSGGAKRCKVVAPVTE